MIYHLHYCGEVKPKARPRVTRRGTFMPPEYRNMKASAIASLRRQWAELGQQQPIAFKARIYMFFAGKHSRSSDYVDNVPGTLYDAMTEAGILKSDNGLWSPSGIHDLAHSKAEPTVDIFIAQWMPLTDSIEQMQEVSAFLLRSKTAA